MNLKEKLLSVLSVQEWEDLTDMEKDDVTTLIEFQDIYQESKYKQRMNNYSAARLHDILCGGPCEYSF